MSKDTALEKAIKVVGTGYELAQRIGVTPQAVSGWKRIPPMRVLAVSEITGIPPHELRPDLYPAPAQAEAS